MLAASHRSLCPRYPWAPARADNLQHAMQSQQTSPTRYTLGDSQRANKRETLEKHAQGNEATATEVQRMD
jgi:hypothetical protein